MAPPGHEQDVPGVRWVTNSGPVCAAPRCRGTARLTGEVAVISGSGSGTVHLVTGAHVSEGTDHLAARTRPRAPGPRCRRTHLWGPDHRSAAARDVCRATRRRDSSPAAPSAAEEARQRDAVHHLLQIARTRLGRGRGLC